MRQGEGILGALLMDTLMADKLDSAVDQLHKSSEQTQVLMSDLSQLVGQVNTGQGPIGMLLTDTLVNNNLKEAIYQIKVISKQSAQLSTELLHTPNC
jgi:hypothetical protein